MWFAVLGPLEVDDRGQALALGGPKQRALLAVLLLNANEAVSRDRLIDEVWGAHPPGNPSQALDTYISRLRKLLGPERVVRNAGGYVLRVVDPDELDLDRFERLASDGAYREALALWRGPALADLLFEPFAATEAERLEERRLDVLEERIERDLAVGGGADLVGELEQLVRAQPLRERLVGQLMVALYRTGRQAAALAAYRTARRKLAEELGIEPGPQLQELERRVLAHDPGLAPGPDAPEDLGNRPSLSRRRAALAVGAGLAVVGAIVAGVLVSAGGTPVVKAVPPGNALFAVNEGSARLVASGTALPGAPAAMIAGRGSLWLAEPDQGAVLRVDPSSRAVVDRIPVAGSPAALAIAGGSVWVATVQGSKLLRIDPATEKVVQTVPLGGAGAAALAAGEGGLWVADPTDGALIEIDPATGAPDRTVTVGLRPTALAIGADAIWAADYDADEVAEVDPTSANPLATIHVGNGPAALAVGDGSVWVANSLDGTVSRIDPRSGSVAATIAVGSGPAALAVTHASVWVANQFGGTLSRIDPSRADAAAPESLGGGPTALAASRGRIWVGTRPLGLHRGGTLRLLSSQPLLPLDPALNFTISPLQLAGFTGDPLVTFEHTGGPDGQRLVPDLAVSLPLPEDGGRTYTFRLRGGIRYSDGRLLRASDFRRAFERLFLLHSGATGFFAGIVGASACLRTGSTTCDLSRGIVCDDRGGTVTFHLVAPDPNFLFKLTIGGFSMPVPPGTPNRPLDLRPVLGTGPYKIAFAGAESIRFVRNPYFREWSHAAQPDGDPNVIVWRFGLPVAQEVREIETGKADWAFDEIPAKLLDAVRERYAGQLHAAGPTETDFYQLNTTVAPFDDLRVRQALNYALDRNEIVRLYGGSLIAGRTCQVLPPAIPGFRRYCPYTRAPNGSGEWRGPDLARAERLVAASGTRSDKVTVWGWTDDSTITPAVTRYTAGVLARLGYRVRTRLIPHAGYDKLPAATRRAIQLIPAGWAADYPSAYDFVDLWLSCRGTYDHGWFCDPRIDREMRHADALQTSNPALATRRWAVIDHQLVDQAAWVPLANPSIPDFVSARAGNYQHNPVLGIVADQLWLR